MEEGKDGRDRWVWVGMEEATTGALLYPRKLACLAGLAAGAAVQLETSRRAASGAALSPRAPWVSLLISTKDSFVFPVHLRLPAPTDPTGSPTNKVKILPWLSICTDILPPAM